MEHQTGSAQKLPRLKQRLFVLCLLVFVLASFVLLCASPAPEGLGSSFSPGLLLDGTFLEQNGFWGGLMERDVLYDNQIPPQLLLMGSQEIQLEVGTSFSEPGYFAQDARYHELTDQVQVRAQGDQILYEVTDALGNTTRCSRTLTYVDTIPPDLRLTGEAEMHIPFDSEYVEPGYAARDSADGVLTEQVTVTGTVDTSKPGAYLLTYTVEDSAGNQSMERRTVYVDLEDGTPFDESMILPEEDAGEPEPVPEEETALEETPEVTEAPEETPIPEEEAPPEETPESTPAIGFTEADTGM